MAHNKLKEWSEVDKLAELGNLRTVVFIGNEMYNSVEGDPRLAVLKRVPQLTMIDGVSVTMAEKDMVAGEIVEGDKQD
jgi:hypothetical protein